MIERIRAAIVRAGLADLPTDVNARLADYGFDIREGSEQSWDFAFKIPRGSDSRTRFRLYATADIPGAIDPSAKCDVPTTDQAAVPESAAD